jgi:LysR family transcriptional activator of glutamate synthase operon
LNAKSRTVRLTQGGEDFLGHVNLLLSNLENAKQCIQTYRGLLTGTLKIGMIAALGSLDYANMVADFYTQHPGIKFEFVQAGTYALLDKLSNREIEIAFVVRPEEHEYKDIQFRHLVYDDYVLALPMNHRLAGRTSVDLAEIADERFIFHPPRTVCSPFACKRATMRVSSPISYAKATILPPVWP